MKYATKVELKKKKSLSTNGKSTPKIPSRLEMVKQKRSGTKKSGAGVNRSRAISSGSKPNRDHLDDDSPLFQMPSISISGLRKFRLSKKARKRLKTGLLIFFGLVLIIGIISGLWVYSYLKRIDQELPPRESFFPNQDITSIVYDRDGQELAKFVGDRVASEVDITQVPEKVKWAFLAAEDVDFYTHPGFDVKAIAYCGFQYVINNRTVVCGGSTITQQVVKLVLEDAENSVERKLREMLMAVKIEQAYTKEQILEIYLSVAGFGSNIYGVTMASDFYFGKDLEELNLAEAAILASIVNQPTYLSPTKGIPDPETAQIKVKWRQENVVLTQMLRNVDKINEQTRLNYADPELPDVVTREEIEAAFETELSYLPPVVTDWKAGHFVDYVKHRLLTGDYKYGEPFTESELASGGYKIYTTLDWKIQQVAEKNVKQAVDRNKRDYNVSNAALILTNPKTGEIVSMVGSKDYFGEKEGCDKQDRNCKFDPQVNILLTRQSPGSSTKPFGFYEAYRQGLIFTGSFLPDIPVRFNEYTIKNYNNKYNGVGLRSFASQQLQDSRNLPSVIVLEAIGVQRFLEVMRTFGYTTYNNDPNQYGYSVILGGSDVIPLEHAQAYGVYANGGDLVKVEVISRIEDKDGNVIFEHQPKKTRVADEKAVYLVNQSLINTFGISWDGRVVSGKSGTSENATDLWYAAYSPDFVAIGWMGNNNNKPLAPTANGANNVLPWVRGFLREIKDTDYLKSKTNFRRPAGVKRGGGCPEQNQNNCEGEYVGVANGWMIEGIEYAVDNIRTRIRVCKDQGNRLARPIDEYYDNAKFAKVYTFLMPYTPQWQEFLDEYMQGPKSKYGYAGFPNGGPTQYCTSTYDGQVDNGVWISDVNLSNGMTISNTVNIQGNVFTLEPEAEPTEVEVRFDSEVLGTIAVVDNKFNGTVTVPAAFDNGVYTLTLTGKDSANNNYVLTYSVTLNNTKTAKMVVSVPDGVSGGATADYIVTVGPTATTLPIKLQMDYSSYTGGKTLKDLKACIKKDGVADFTCTKVNGNGPVYVYNWNPTATNGVRYSVKFEAGMGSSGKLVSNTITVRLEDEVVVVTPPVTP